jgi:hypothetical protein
MNVDSIYKTGRCPHCDSEEWYEGPSGGMCTNWYCANEECGAGFNLSGIPGFNNQQIRSPKPKIQESPVK